METKNLKLNIDRFKNDNPSKIEKAVMEVIDLKGFTQVGKIQELTDKHDDIGQLFLSRDLLGYEDDSLLHGILIDDEGCTVLYWSWVYKNATTKFKREYVKAYGYFEIVIDSSC